MQCTFRRFGKDAGQVTDCKGTSYTTIPDAARPGWAGKYVIGSTGMEIFAQPDDPVPSDPAEQILKAGMLAQGIEVGILLDPVAVAESGLDRALETLDRPVRLVLE